MSNTTKKEKKKEFTFIQYANGKSLEEINGTVRVPHGAHFWRTLLAYTGPGALVAVGYMDPGNWSTDITGGQNFGYLLISVIVISGLIAMLLQYMSAKLGIVTQMDLAQIMRASSTKVLGFIMWILTELAIMATDIAEVIGAAIALNLLFHIPMVVAVLLTAFDVLLLLLLTKIGFRKIEALVACLITVILLVFIYQVWLSKPNWAHIMAGFIPVPKVMASSPSIGGDTPLTASLGIIGATVMPHNLFLHSSISQARELDYSKPEDLKQSVRFTTWDSNIQLTIATVVNVLLLITGVAVFKSGAIKDPSFFGLYQALNTPSSVNNSILADVSRKGILGFLFAIALLASGQNSTITGTLTGQIIMEGFVHMHIPMWARRLITRFLAIVPVIACVILTSSSSPLQEHIALNDLMNNSQVFLALDLPFAMLPLLMLTNSEKEMRQYKNTMWVKILGWISVIGLVYLNVMGLPTQMAAFFSDNPTKAELATGADIAYIVDIFMFLLLIWMFIEIKIHLKNSGYRDLTKTVGVIEKKEDKIKKSEE